MRMGKVAHREKRKFMDVAGAYDKVAGAWNGRVLRIGEKVRLMSDAADADDEKK